MREPSSPSRRSPEAAAEIIWRDLRYALRQLARARGFAAAAVLTLALGIGGTTAVFSIVEGVLMRPLPYRDPQQLVVVWQTDAVHRASGAYFNSYREFEAFQTQSSSFASLAALSWATESKSTVWRGRPMDVLAIPASVDFFSLLGQSAGMGRTFARGDMDSSCTLVLSHHFWQEKLGAPADIAGQSMRLNESACTVVGVMPAAFSFYPTTTDAWTLISSGSTYAAKPWQSMTGIFGRLKPGVSPAAAEAELTAIQAHVVQQAPPNLEEMRMWTPDVLGLQSNFIWLAGRNLRQGLWLLLAASGLMLLIATVNVGGLMLSRAMARARELAVRSALGSSRRRLFLQSLVESSLLAVCGTVAGLGLACAAISWFRSVNPVELPPGAVISLDAHVLLIAVAGGTLSCLVYAALPVWHNARLNVNEALKSSGGHSSQTASRLRASRALVVVQIALSTVLVLAAVLVSISLSNLTSTNLGYRTDHLFTATVKLPQARFAKPEARVRFAERLLQSLGEIPGLASAAVASDYVPRGLYPLAIAGRPDTHAAAPDVGMQAVSPSALATLNIPLLEGRNFDDRDRQGAQQVAIINEALAHKYFAGRDPLGHAIKLSRADDQAAPWLTVIGVAADVKTTTVFQEMGYVENPAVYRPLAQVAPASVMVIAAISKNTPVLEGVQRKVSDIDPTLLLSSVDAMHEEQAQVLSQPRFRAVLFAGFAALALVLALVGLYGSLSQTVARRNREISIRMSLGAGRRRVLFSVLREALSLTVAGAFAGGICAALGMRITTGLFYGIRADGAEEFAGSLLILLLLTMACAVRPAWRAASIDPIRALREE